MTEDQVKELVKTKREELSSLLPAEIKKKAEFYIDKIFSMLSFETKPMAVEFLIDFYKFVYDMPASPDVDFFGAHHQQEFGLFLHSLEVCWETLKRTQDRTFIKQKDGVFFSATYYTTKFAQEYVIFLTSLCHDIGKVLTYKVINKTQRTIHKPFLMSLYDFKKQTEDAEMEIQFTPYDHRHFSLLLFCLLSKSDLEFLTEPKPTQGYSLDGIEYLFDILSGEGETEFGREILDILREADKASVVENIREEEPEY
ncbi:MAG TPA: TraI domain-containing protein, partial [Candidatus Ratteibacteria bacterium]|nr:TraI domain-containing protein [Candidatus Ratteibacteria bacterium]